MTFTLAPTPLTDLSDTDDLRRALAAALSDAGIADTLIEHAAEYWATDDEVVVSEAERSNGTVRATGHVAFTDTPWEACGATVHAQRRTIPIALEVDLDSGNTKIQVA
ncbi:MAG: hypothetical protein AAF624_04890 [Bacteroidota bacterium]